MPSAPHNSVLQQKLGAAGDVEAADMSRGFLRAIRLALARVAAELFDLPLAVIGIRQDQWAGGDLEERVPSDALLLMLDGADGAIGAFAIDAAGVQAVTQHQVFGAISGDVEDRRFTDTDAALIAPLVDGTFEKAEGLIDQPEEGGLVSGVRFGARAETRQALMLALDREEYRAVSITAEVADGAVQARILVLLPIPPSESAENPMSDAEVKADTSHAFSNARVELDAIVGRIMMPLSDFAKMSPGDLLTLPVCRLDQTELVSIDRKPVISGRLGQFQGVRAVRINETEASPVPDLHEHSHRSAVASTNEIPALERQVSPLPNSAEHRERLAEDHIARSEEAHVEQALPAAISANPSSEDEAEDNTGDLLALSPDEAAAEISELAGLSQ